LSIALDPVIILGRKGRSTRLVRRTKAKRTYLCEDSIDNLEKLILLDGVIASLHVDLNKVELRPERRGFSDEWACSENSDAQLLLTVSSETELERLELAVDFLRAWYQRSNELRFSFLVAEKSISEVRGQK
jgi:hypothetical protein